MCEFCQRPFSDKSNLNSHRRRKHQAAPVFGRGNPGKKNRLLGAKNWTKSYIQAGLRNRPDSGGQQNLSPMLPQSNEIDSSSFMSSGMGDAQSSSAFSILKNDLPTMVNQNQNYLKIIKKSSASDTIFPKVFSIQTTSPMTISDRQSLISTANFVHFDKDGVLNSDYMPSNDLLLHRSIAGVGKYSPPSDLFTQRQERDAQSFNQQKLVSSSTGTASTSTQTDGEKSESASTNMHECKHCGIFFKDYVMYTVHMGCHAGDSPFKCNICQVDCGDAIQFACHFARGHSK